MNRITNAFQHANANKRIALIAYVVAGFPNRETSLDLLKALSESGVDAIELGVPFSDPMADGPVIREATYRALQQGATLSWILELAASAREAGIKIPILLMGYCNPFLAYGLERLSEKAKNIIDGFLVPDLPVEEISSWRSIIEPSGMSMIGFIAPTTTPSRRARILESSSGFVYAIAVKGITGTRDELAPELKPMIQTIKEQTNLPVAVGFGIAGPGDIADLHGIADGAIVGSALIKAIAKNPQNVSAAAQSFIQPLQLATAGRKKT